MPWQKAFVDRGCCFKTILYNTGPYAIPQKKLYWKI
jgi:hypothetical protein